MYVVHFNCICLFSNSCVHMAYTVLHYSTAAETWYKHVAACMLLCVLPLPPIVLRVVNIDRVDTGQWVNFSTADLGSRMGESISFLVLPQNIGNLSSCPTAIVSGAVAGLHLVLPQYSNFTAPTASGNGSENRILSGLWLVALSPNSPIQVTCYTHFVCIS